MTTRSPLLLEIPMPIITPQLAIRPYRETDCAGLVDAIKPDECKKVKSVMASIAKLIF